MTATDSSIGEQAVAHLVEHGYGPRSEIRGCTDEELDSLEEQFDLELPAAYRSCMRHIRADTNGFFRGSEFTYPAPKYQRQFAEDSLDEWEHLDFSFDHSDFVFRGLQGSAFWFFDTEAGADPPVYRYMEDEEPELVSDTFSEWLFDEIRKRGTNAGDE
ncbi:hypothetical protein C479_04157 [Halovivax asiaticus JCM 14624]|uniref:Knr4/Smi1-like domain-containing protein n=1 Tax=Halovivax asiaticus JCM 14624 TaxID=1227490 RepID=M0BQE5_9EURY|nr:SMI1/KNR4 family protein [Halovivax asiaticus]ELZ12558.1 hypothetical protein C479_04157 [Halovivax asiaticus JCM 14624]